MTAYRLRRAFPVARSSSLLCHSILKQLHAVQEFLPVVHRLCLLPRLRSRLTLGRRALPRIPSAFGGYDSHVSFRYSYQHSHFHALQLSFRSAFYAHGTLPYPAAFAADATSVLYLSPGYFRRRASRPVSYYALFEWWLLLSQHPGCLGSSTSFST